MTISLKIKGNKRSSDGVGADLLVIGDGRFPVLDQQYPGVKGVTDFIIIRHLPDKSVYTIATTNVVPCDSQRPGALFLSVAIPVGYQVEGLFSLLLELSGFYKSNYMTFDGSTYRFTSRAESPEGFEEILAKHPVVPYPYRPIVMAPDANEIAYVFMTPDNISQVLTDTMRPEFSRFGQVVLVPVANPVGMGSTIEVAPRIWRVYRIFINGKESHQTIDNPDKMVNITIPETETTEAAASHFSINTARAGKAEGVVADDVAQILYVKIIPRHKEIIPNVNDAARVASMQRRKLLSIISIAVAVALAILFAAWLLGFFGGGKSSASSTEGDNKPTPHRVITTPDEDKTDGTKSNNRDLISDDKDSIFGETNNSDDSETYSLADELKMFKNNLLSDNYANREDDLRGIENWLDQNGNSAEISTEDSLLIRGYIETYKKYFRYKKATDDDSKKDLLNDIIKEAKSFKMEGLLKALIPHDQD